MPILLHPTRTTTPAYVVLGGPACGRPDRSSLLHNGARAVLTALITTPTKEAMS